MFKPVGPKIDFPSLERDILKYWQVKKIGRRYLAKNSTAKVKFSFLDGPITANNPMGVHHAWGRAYKDLWQRFFNMLGRRQRFQNGFDEQGLWVEVEVEKELGLKTKKDIENLVAGNTFGSIAKFVNLCKERVKKYSDIMTKQSKRLGYFMDWDNSYHTSSDQNNYAIWHYLKTVHEKGWLYKGRDSVPWCPRCGTAISQHEILTEEYQQLVHDSIFLKLPVTTEPFRGLNLLVWTTTPWTIPGNVAVAVDPKKDYAVTKEDLIVMKERVEDLGLVSAKTIKGADLVGQRYAGPFDHLDRVKEALKSFDHRVVDGGELVTEEEGTGLVHIAPGAGEEDFKLSQEQGLAVIELIEEDASYLERLGEFSGKNAKNQPEIIVDFLAKSESGKFLFKTGKYKHRYPVCWRCKAELVWRVVDEWYIAVDRKDPKRGKTYRELMKEVIKGINWIPKWGYERELDWLNNLHDWLISKKRYWGLALPIWECAKCGNFEVIGSRQELKKRAAEGWKGFDGHSPHRPWVDQVKIRCLKCGEIITRIADVGNPWLDAGIVPFSTLKYFEDKDYWKDWFPADFVTESFPGQFKNWFYSLIAMATALEYTHPFKVLLGHGQVRDERGEEMHKSKGNAIEFNEAAEKMGVDVMRWLYLRTNPEHNVNFGYHVADEVRRFFHLRLWNVYSFFVTYASLEGWQPSKETFRPKHVLDRWILSRLHRSSKTIEEKLREYNACEPVVIAETFVVNDLSNWYVRRIRDRVGPTVPSRADKDEAYQTLWTVLTTYSRVLSPMIPFVSEEIYCNLTREESVHLSDWPIYQEELADAALEEEMARARGIVEVGHAIRKAKSIKVRQPLTTLSYKGEPLARELEHLIADELNVKLVVNKKNLKVEVLLDATITQKLRREGKVRDLIRSIQEKRRQAGVPFDSLVTVYAPSWPREFEDLIKKETLAEKLISGKEIKVELPSQ